MRAATRQFLRRLLALWVTLGLLAVPLAPLRAADVSAPAPMADSSVSMSAMSDSSAQMDDGSAPCEACDKASSQACGGADCAHGGCVHGGCSVYLLRQAASDTLSRQVGRSRTIPVAGYRSHQPDLPKRPPIL